MVSSSLAVLLLSSVTASNVYLRSSYSSAQAYYTSSGGISLPIDNSAGAGYVFQLNSNGNLAIDQTNAVCFASVTSTTETPLLYDCTPATRPSTSYTYITLNTQNFNLESPGYVFMAQGDGSAPASVLVRSASRTAVFKRANEMQVTFFTNAAPSSGGSAGTPTDTCAASTVTVSAPASTLTLSASTVTAAANASTVTLSASTITVTYNPANTVTVSGPVSVSTRTRTITATATVTAPPTYDSCNAEFGTSGGSLLKVGVTACLIPIVMVWQMWL